MRALAVVLLALAATGCDRWVEVAYVTEAPPPAPPASEAQIQQVTLAEHTSAAIVFVLYDQADIANPKTGDAVRSLDERIVRVERASADADVTSEGGKVRGRPFVAVGLASGDTSLEVFRDGESRGLIPVHVLAQE